MSPWTISTVTANVSAAWERGFSWTGRGKDAGTLLKEIDGILRNTDTLLEHHKPLFALDEYSSFKARHRTYYLKWSDELQQHDNINEEAVQRTRTPSEISADRETSQARANDLLKVVKIYRSTLIEASHKAIAGPAPAFPDEEPTSEDPPVVADSPTPVPTQSQPAVAPPSRSSSPPRVPKVSVLPTNVGLMGMLRTRIISSSQPAAQLTRQAMIEGQGFAIAIAHILVDPERNLYRRMVSVKAGDRQVEIPDPDLHVLEADKVDIDEPTLTAICILVAKRMLDPDMFQKTIEELQGEID
ncbi:hypothetical protein FRC07_000088 [Ceratobasidium sp. 392]|nr:hypothetical protein FRC07_000088 [Ceratobasidium sp. 392]